MNEKNAATVIIVAIIGAIGVIVASCIGLIPTILPLVRPTVTPFIFVTDTASPSATPAPDTPTVTFAPPTDTPTETATQLSLGTATETSTTVPTPASSSSDIDDYVGTWINVDSEPASEKVKLVVTRIEISKTGDTTADFSVCRITEDGDYYVLPHPTSASFYDFALVARDFTIPRFSDFRWTIFVQQSGEQLVATVQEYDMNQILLDSDTFRLEKPSLLGSITLDACGSPPTPTP